LPAAIHLINQLKSGLGSGFKIVGIYKVGFIFILPLIILFLIQGLSTLGGFILLIIPGVIISLYSAFSVYTLVLEGKRGFSAIEDSYSIVHGRLWVIIIRSLFIGIVAGLISIAIVGLQYIVGAMLGIDNPLGTVVQGQVLEPLFSRTLLIGIFSIVSSGIVIPLSAVYGYLLFTSAKETRSPNVDTKTFRKVVMGFMIFGIAILIAILSFAPFVVKSVLNSIKKGQIPTATSISASVFQSNILGN
jgi:hypothetical protein